MRGRGRLPQLPGRVVDHPVIETTSRVFLRANAGQRPRMVARAMPGRRIGIVAELPGDDRSVSPPMKSTRTSCPMRPMKPAPSLRPPPVRPRQAIDLEAEQPGDRFMPAETVHDQRAGLRGVSIEIRRACCDRLRRNAWRPELARPARVSCSGAAEGLGTLCIFGKVQ